MSDLPALSRGDVRNWTEQRFFDRGDTYFQQDRIQHPRRVGNTLKAECRGSQPQPYHVEATLDAEGILDAECSCPMGGGGYCKHVVALLLTWVESAEAFSTQASLEETLHQRPKGQLVDLLLRMVDRHPDLERLVTASAQADAPLDPDRLRRDIEAAFQAAAPSHDYGAHSTTNVVDNVQPYLSLGDDLARQGRQDDAVTAYRLFTEIGCEHYLKIPGDNERLADLIRACTERLGDALADMDAPDLREEILRTLFEAYVTDLDLGGNGLGDAAKRILLNASRPAERQQISEWVRARLPEMDGPADGRRVIVLGSSGPWSQDRTRKALGGFLLDLLDDSLDEETALQLCRDTGRTEDLVGRLLSRGRMEEALGAVESLPDRTLFRLAPTFAEHDATEALYNLGLDRLHAGTDPQFMSWIRDQAEERGDLERALSLSRRLFWDQRSPDAYERVRAVARRLDRWAEVQSDIHDHLRSRGACHLLTRLHLADRNVDAALETLPDATLTDPRSSLALDVAEAAEAPHPEAAMDIYTDRGRALIEARGRDNYQTAAALYGRVKALCDRVDPDRWPDVLGALYDEELHRLPAARDEFEQAGLL
ncbi:MAG: SWIM zinc finger family protein [Salinibacter sp.]|uniref:SWIM zinc finger family protein n=1 Tax=Salinibacter sp. TaxID=2065818 RepID=UPI002FC29482